MRYVVLHKRFATPEQLAAWRDWLTFDPDYEDDQVIVYRTAPEVGRDFMLSQPMTDNLGLIRVGLSPTGILQGESMYIDARWASTAAPDRNDNVCVMLTSASGQAYRLSCEPLIEGWPTSEWGANAIAHGEYAVPTDPFWEPGRYSVQLMLVDAATGDSRGQPATIGSLQVTGRQRIFTPPPITHAVGAQWTDAFTLLGYDAQTSPGALTLNVVWQAQRRMTNSYKVFVHVTDVATGAIVAQDDSIPRQWSYPTNWWEQNEIVTDTITIPLDQVAAGRYEVIVGAYQPDTGQRLAVRTSSGEPYPDDLVPLTSIVH